MSNTACQKLRDQSNNHFLSVNLEPVTPALVAPLLSPLPMPRCPRQFLWQFFPRQFRAFHLASNSLFQGFVYAVIHELMQRNVATIALFSCCYQAVLSVCGQGIVVKG